jgi:hypothetical protein
LLCFLSALALLRPSSSRTYRPNSKTTLSKPPSSESLASTQDNTGTLAVTAQAPGQAWGRWPEQNTHQQPIETFYAMDISGLIQSYDSRAASSAALTRAIMAPHYIPVHSFSGAPSNSMVVAHPQMQQSNPFTFGPYSGAGQNGVIPAFASNYIQQRPLPRPQPDTPYARNTRQGYIEEHHSQSPPIKSEPQWNGSITSPSFPSTNTKTITTTTPITGSNEVNFGTEVDTLMKAIQAKTQSTTPQKPSSADQSRPVVGVSRTPPYVQASPQARAYGSGDSSQYKLTQKDVQEEASPKGGKKRYQCTIENCTKSFYQKTHLDIHERAHTGVKPYVSSLSFILHKKLPLILLS